MRADCPSIALFSILIGGSLTQVGWYVPFLVAGSILTSIGAGLLYTLNATMDSAKYIGYQALFGIGVGIALNVPTIANQAMSDTEDVPLVTATILCESFSREKWSELTIAVFQTMGGAFFVSAAQNIFSNRLVEDVSSRAPSIAPASIIATGAAELQDVFQTTDLQAVRQAYLTGLKSTWALGIALAGAAFLISFLPEWTSIRAKAQTRQLKDENSV